MPERGTPGHQDSGRDTLLLLPREWSCYRHHEWTSLLGLQKDLDGWPPSFLPFPVPGQRRGWSHSRKEFKQQFKRSAHLGLALALPLISHVMLTSPSNLSEPHFSIQNGMISHVLIIYYCMKNHPQTQ